MWTMAFTGDRWRECSRPISDLRVSSTVSMMKRLRSMILSVIGMRSFFMFLRMPVMRCRAALPEFLEQVFADVALIGEGLAGRMPGHIVQHGAVGGVARGDFQRHDLAFVIDDEVQLEAEKPSHAGLATRCQAIEDLVTLDTAIVTDRELA